jgi:predicted enzyme related to lactoylglutathione lyase
MSERVDYPAGVPCWVETLQPDPRAALEFYGAVFGWEFAGPGPMAGDLPGEYHVAQVDGRDVAGIGSLPDVGMAPVAAWNTYIRVDSADDVVVLADPVGPVFSVWEAHAREGAQLVNQPNAWAMSSLHTTDPEAAQAFYGPLFGWEPEPFGPPEAQMTLWRLPGYVGGEPQQPVPRDVVAALAPAGDGVPPHWNVNFWVDDADATAERAVRAGGQVLMGPVDTPGFRSAVLGDPQGAAVSISQLTAA